MATSTNSAQDRSFMEAFADNVMLDASWVLTWVKDNFGPEEVFELDDLRQCVRDRSTPDEVFEPGELQEWAQENYDPEVP